jgi:hypothetical protein
VVTLSAEMTKYLVQNCPERTNQAIMDKFGIGYNTFRKIEAGEPIRPSLAERLTKKLSHC